MEGSIPNFPVSARRLAPDCEVCTWAGPAAAVTSRRQLAGAIQAGHRPFLKKGRGNGRHPRQGSPKGHAARLRPTWPARRKEKGTAGLYARAWGHVLQARAAPLGPESARPPFGAQPHPTRQHPAPAVPGAPARTHLDVLVLVLAFPAVPAGGAAAAPYLSHRVFHGERVRVYGRERAALVPASAWGQCRLGPCPRSFSSPQESESPAAAAAAAAAAISTRVVSVCEGRVSEELARRR